jgi:class III poly(R)-hydroxyalkanoic acid synthase PhaE subunit
MSRSTNDPAADFGLLARQYWNAWSEIAGKPASSDAIPGWKEGLAWWTQIAGQGNGDVDAALGRMNSQAGDWFGAIQKLAAGFAGRDASAGDIGKAWREMLGAQGMNPLAEMFTRMGGRDAQGIDAWMAQAAPFLAGLRGEARTLLSLPAFGLAREHQERAQQLAQAQLDYQERNNDYLGLLSRAGQDAFSRFESKLAEHSEPGRQIESARALFDLWIDAAEEAWAAIALTSEYREIYGRLVNSQMLLRSRVQREIEVAAGVFGLPTRSEIDASHRKLAAVERELRALKAQGSAPRAERASPPRGAVPSVAPRAAKAPTQRRAKSKPPAAKAIARAATKAKVAVATRPAARKTVVAHVAPPQAVKRTTRTTASAAGKARGARKGR